MPKNDEREFRNANCEIQNAELIALEGLDSIEGMKEELEKRTKLFALEIINFVATLSSNRICEVMGRQLLKSGTSVGANYREAGRAESHDDFIHKIAICEKESAETQYWLELFLEGKLAQPERCENLRKEASELLAIFVASGRTAKASR